MAAFVLVTAALASALAVAAALAFAALCFQLVQLLLKQTQLLFQERNFHIVATGLGYGW